MQKSECNTNRNVSPQEPRNTVDWLQVGAESRELGLRNLLKPIQTSTMVANEVGMVGIYKTQWLLDINSFLQIAMKEGVFHVQLMNYPSERENNQ